MLRFREHAEADGEDALNLTAMVDVVFTLLAFFVITVRFTGPERDLGLGDATLSSGRAQAEDFPANVVVEVWPEGGGVAIRLGQLRLSTNDFPDLTARLREMDVPELPVVIAADTELPVSAVAAAIDAVLASPNQRLSLAPRAAGAE